MSHGPIGGRGRGKGFGGKGFGGKGFAADASAPGTRVYVGNLSWETSWQDLKDHFRASGVVTHADVMQGVDGRSKGCGLVTFATAAEAASAIRDLHDSVLHSRSIFVREDREAALPGLPAPGGRGAAATALPPPPHAAVTVKQAETGAKVRDVQHES